MIYSAYMPLNNERADEWTDSELNEPEAPADEPAEWPDERGDEQCKSESMLEWIERTQLVKPTGKCVTLVNGDGVHWNV